MTDSSVTDDRQIGEPPGYDQQLSVDDKLDADRLQAINEARKTAHKVRQNSRVGELGGRWGEDQSAAVFREALESYLTEIRQYRDVSDTAKEYWLGGDSPLGLVVIQPPEGYEDKEAVLAAEIQGLDDILSAPAVFSATFEKEVTHRHGPDSTEKQTVHKALDRDILKRGLLWANEYCRHIGLDLDLEDEEPHGVT